MKNIEFTVNEVIVDGITYIKAEAKKPEFKVPGWYVHEKDGKQTIFYAIGIGHHYLTTNDNGYYTIWLCRPATPQEIESHLRKICDEKYIGKAIISLNCNERRDAVKFKEYDFASDTIFYYDQTSGYIASVYCEGKWAEIIPDKKKLPKTKEELRQLILKLHRIITLGTYPIGEPWTVDNFLKDYED